MKYKLKVYLILFLIPLALAACGYPKPGSKPIDSLDRYAFPETIDPSSRYMFYRHGKIIEDQGIPAISTEYGEYEYEAIIKELSSHGFILIGEIRGQNTDPAEYASKVAGQVYTLLAAGVPPGNITVVGASKGAGITIYLSHTLKNTDINFVLLAICHPDQVRLFVQENIYLVGNVLSIFDSNDHFAGSCQELFSFSESSGGGNFDELVLEIGTGHGILYQPNDAWINPAVEWALRNPQ